MISGYARMENTIPTAGMFTGNAVLNILMMSSGKVSGIGTGLCHIVSRYGEVNMPVLYPAARRTASSMAQVDPFPLVPAT